VEPPPSQPAPGKGDVETAGVSTSEIAPSFAVWQEGFVRGNPGWDFHITLLNRNKKTGKRHFWVRWPSLVLQGFPRAVWGTRRGVRDGQRQKGGTSPAKCLCWS